MRCREEDRRPVARGAVAEHDAVVDALRTVVTRRHDMRMDVDEEGHGSHRSVWLSARANTPEGRARRAHRLRTIRPGGRARGPARRAGARAARATRAGARARA